jgi:hypothetical protein
MKKQGGKHSGGTLASDNVLKSVSDSAFENLNKNATNQLGGNIFGENFRIYNTTGGAKGARNVHRGGGAACDAPIMNVFDTYTLSVDTVPKTSPSANLASLDYSQVTGSVLKALQANVDINQSAYNHVAFPASPSSLSTTKLLSGGSASACMCGPQ